MEEDLDHKFKEYKLDIHKIYSEKFKCKKDEWIRLQIFDRYPKFYNKTVEIKINKNMSIKKALSIDCQYSIKEHYWKNIDIPDMILGEIYNKFYKNKYSCYICLSKDQNVYFMNDKDEEVELGFEI